MTDSLRDLGEDPLISRLVGLMPQDSAPWGRPGDDCAVVPGRTRGMLQLLKTDAIVEGVHFLTEASPRKVGWKAVARVVSDFAAMGGGQPERFLVTLALPASWPVKRIEGIYRGMADCLKQYGGVLAGGETTRVPEGSAAVISIAATGQIPKRQLTLRSGARPGDLVLVTGKLGGSLSGRHLSFPPRQQEADWLAKQARPTAMMDLSDGLAKDLPRLAKASGCGFELMPDSIPKNRGCTLDQALSDGEDFELLLTVSPKRVQTLQRDWQRAFPKLALSVIGTMTSSTGQALQGGWDPFVR